MAVIESQLARRFVLELKDCAAHARNRADAEGDASSMERVISDATRLLPEARVLLDPGARRELRAIDAEIAARLEALLSEGWAREGRIRSSFALRRIRVGDTVETWRGLMLRFRSSDPEIRGGAASALAAEENAIDELLETAAPAPGSMDAGVAEVARELAHATAGAKPRDYAAWRAAAAGMNVADFRLRSLHLIASPASWTQLPFEQPATPLARPRSITAPAADAWQTLAHVLSAVPRALAGAFAAAMATAPFMSRGLSGAPADPLRARRAFACGIALLWLEAKIAAQCGGDPGALRDLAQGTFGAAPPRALASSMAAEQRLAARAGEEDALYLHVAEVADLLQAGAALAARLRDTFDEDWFRNPRVTAQSVESMELPEAKSPATLINWLVEQARL